MANVPVNSQDLRVAIEILDMMQGPMQPADVAMVIRMSSYLLPKLEDAFTNQGLDPNDIDLPEFPLLKPGDLYKG